MQLGESRRVGGDHDEARLIERQTCSDGRGRRREGRCVEAVELARLLLATLAAQRLDDELPPRVAQPRAKL
jgi:hypothetical protein